VAHLAKSISVEKVPIRNLGTSVAAAFDKMLTDHPLELLMLLGTLIGAMVLLFGGKM
jgi:hypothetical protein